MKDNSIYQKEYWEKYRKRRHPSHPVIQAFAEPKVHYIRSLLEPEIGKNLHKITLLDVGCGNGFLTYYFEKRFCTFGLDSSKFMLSMNPCENKVCGSVRELPFPDNSFDIITCSNLLHHLQDPFEAVREMWRVSKKYVILSEPNRNNPLMFLFGLLKKEERGSLKFSTKFLKKLIHENHLYVVASTTLGSILPNKTPRRLLPFVKILDGRYPLSFYCIAIGRKYYHE